MISTGMLLPRPRKLLNIVKARSRPSRTDEAEIKNVLAVYDLGSLRAYRHPPIGPSRSRNLIMDTSDGRYVLKRYKSSMSLEGITYEHSVLSHLAADDFPSPHLIPDREGNTCVEMHGAHYALFDFVPGFCYADYFIPAGKKRAFIAEAGRTLCRYHQIMDGFAPAGRKLDGFMPGGKGRWRDTRWYLDQFERYKTLFQAKGEKSSQEKFFADNLDRLGRCYDDLNQRIGEHADRLRKVVNHGDYGPHNLLFDERGVAAVLDFECVHLNLRAIDVITALKFFAGRDVGLDYDRASVFLGAYSLSCPLTTDEVELTPHIFQSYLLERLAYYFRDYFDSTDFLRLDYARWAVAWADWVEKNGDDLVEALLVSQDKRDL
jgi:Ser/Thr protein kinase RdoA (MazF antagonist)